MNYPCVEFIKKMKKFYFSNHIFDKYVLLLPPIIYSKKISSTAHTYLLYLVTGELKPNQFS